MWNYKILNVVCLALMLCVQRINSTETVEEKDEGDQEHKHDADDETVEKVKEHHSHWAYTGLNGVDSWADDYEACGGSRQSPINIEEKTSQLDEKLDNIDLLMPSNMNTSSLNMVNNGHTVNLAVLADIFISGGHLIDEYQVAGFHFHWGDDSSRGSEHTVNDEAYPIEMHIVSYDVQRYASLVEAVTETDALAVLGVLFKVTDEDNPVLTPIVEQLSNIQVPSSEPVALPLIDLRDLLPDNTDDYYRYLGSLTTPGCFESVIWTVFKDPQTISERQLDQFRGLLETSDMDSVNLVNNYRPVQQLHSRTVSRSFTVADDNSDTGNGNSGVEDPDNAAPVTCTVHTIALGVLTTTLALLL